MFEVRYIGKGLGAYGYENLVNGAIGPLAYYRGLWP